MTTATEALLLSFPTNSSNSNEGPTEFEVDANLIKNGYVNADFDATTGLINIPVHSGTGTIGFGSYVPQNYTGPGAIYLYAVIIKDTAGNVLVNEEFNTWTGSLPALTNGEATTVFTGDSGREWGVYSNASSIFTGYGAEFAAHPAGEDNGIVYPVDGAGPFSVLMSTNVTIAEGVTGITVDLRWGYEVSNGGQQARTFALGYQNTVVSTKDLFAFLSAGPDTTPPTLEITSSANALTAGETATITFTFSEDPGETFTWDGTTGSIVVTGGTLSAISGTGTMRTAVFTPNAGVNNGIASISVAPGTYADAAGNAGVAGSTPVLAFDTLAPDAPGMVTLAVASDTGMLGDGRTTTINPVIEGSGAAPNAEVYVYDGATRIGTAVADATGKWTMSTNLAYGNHAVTVVQLDATGNASAASTAFTLAIARPASPSAPSTTVDGVKVISLPVTTPGGSTGTSVLVPVVQPGRTEASGDTSTADIPLASQSGEQLLVAKVHTGFGLSANGGITQGNASSLAELIAAIKATGTTNGISDVSHLTNGGTSFLSLLPTNTSLLVETIRVTGSDTDGFGALDLVGNTNTRAAIVLDATQLAAGTHITLTDIPFAAVFGATNVTATTAGQILTGDAADQTFIVSTGAGSTVLSGAGADTLQFGFGTSASRLAVNSQTVASSTLLHGGSDTDVAVFNGVASDFTIEQHDGYVLVSSNSKPEQVAKLVNVEQLKFSDQNIMIESRVELKTLAGLYQSVLGRQADVVGFDFWGTVEHGGMNLGKIAVGLLESTEGVARMGALNGDAGHDIEILYKAMFERTVDAGGKAFWVEQMANGASLEEVANGMAHSTEIVGQQQSSTAWDFMV